MHIILYRKGCCCEHSCNMGFLPVTKIFWYSVSLFFLLILLVVVQFIILQLYKNLTRYLFPMHTLIFIISVNSKMLH